MSATPIELLTLVLVLCAAAGGVFAALAARRAAATGGADERVAEALRRELADLRRELDAKAATQRSELLDALTRVSDSLDKRVVGLTESLDKRVEGLTNNLTVHFTGFAELQQKSSDNLAETQRRSLSETSAAVAKLAETLAQQQLEGRKAMAEELEKVRQTLSQNLDQLRKENDAKLEQMRLTVEEKLQGTLEKRLGESFKQVSERLEQVHKGLGDMQNLANGVGDLKRVLTDVRQRGAWGEVQLAGLLEDMLTPDQYERQAKVRNGSDERVDFAIRLPGQADDEPVLVPIDCKFPQEDYDRLLQAQSSGDPAAVAQATKALEKAIRTQAKSIEEKYVHPPRTTNFAVMYLPTEGLFAEVMRSPGLALDLQRKYRVTVTGPTTLAAMLNAFRMGFATLAIQKRSGEVWQVLGAAKAEFQKYGQVWDKLGKQLDTARRTVDEAGRRTRAVERKLRGVEAIDVSGSPMLALEHTLFTPADDDEPADEDVTADEAAE